MRGNVRLGTIFGFEIRLDYSWFIVFFLLAWSLSVRLFPGMYDFGRGTSFALGIIAAVLLFASVLVHEIGHALVARQHGIEVDGITLFLFGGVAQIRDEPRRPMVEFLIAAVGPVISLVLGGLFIAIAMLTSRGGPTPVGALFSYLGVINVVLALFNLVPGFPLDGGRILRAIIWHFTGSLKKATRWAAYVGQAFAWFLMGYGLIYLVLMRGDLGGLWLVFIGWFLNNAAEAAYQQLLLRRALSGVPVSEVMDRDIPTVRADMPVSEFVDDYLLRYDYSVYPVAQEGEFLGVATVSEVRELDRNEWPVRSVGSLVQPPQPEHVVSANEDAWEALTRMLENDINRLLVLADHTLLGIVSRESVIHLVGRKLRLGLPDEYEGERLRNARSRGIAQ